VARRLRPPRLVRTRGGWTLRLRGEPDAALVTADHDPDRRAALVDADGLDRALIALSSPLGIEGLPGSEAEPLLAAYHEGVAALPPRFGTWAAVGLAAPDPGALATLLDRGFVGACVPAGALAGPAGFERLGGVLETLERRGAPLLVHPGPVRAGAPDTPYWWPALTDYVTEMQVAWHAFAVWGRRAHPSLRVCFAMLAGLAPLHAERLAARGGPSEAVHDQLTFFDTSSYGPRAIDAMLRIVGVDRLLYGSDRPVVAPHSLAPLGAAVEHAIAVANHERVA
jgi:6-methylsalicylate decarboxylase